MRIELLHITPNAEKVIEKAGRTSYQSFEKQTETSYKSFIKMLIRNKHESVLEHASASFRVTGCSRSFTHQLVRHRLCSYTQQSQRYVDVHNFNYIEPDSIKSNKKAHKIFSELIKHSKESYTELQKLGVKNQDARFVLPNAVESQIVITANFREWMHVFTLRCNKKSHPQMVALMRPCYEEFLQKWRHVFQYVTF